jgi:hypothetical protein
MLRNLTLATTLILGLSATALAADQQPQPPAGKAAAGDSTGKKAPAPTPSATGSQATPPAGHEGHHGPGKPAGQPGMMGGGMMGKGMGMCPMMVGSDTKMTVKNLPDGVVITLTNASAETVARLQKAAEGMRLMHEAHGAH